MSEAFDLEMMDCGPRTAPAAGRGHKLVRKSDLRLKRGHVWMSDVLKSMQCGRMAGFRLAETCDLFVPTERNCALHDIHPSVRKYLAGRKLYALHALMDVFGDDSDCAEFQAFFEVDSMQNPTQARLFLPPASEMDPYEFMITGCHFTVEFNLCENAHVIIPDLCDPATGAFSDSLIDFKGGPALFREGVPDWLVSPCVECGVQPSEAPVTDDYPQAPGLRTAVSLTSFFRLWFCPSESGVLSLIRSYLDCGLPLCGRDCSESA